MTYLEVINEVLTRLRQDPIVGIIGEEDESAKMVIKLVNDAKTKVENAHNWSVLRKEWEITTVDSQKRYDLPDSHNYIKVESMSNEDAGYWLDQTSTPLVQFSSSLYPVLPLTVTLLSMYGLSLRQVSACPLRGSRIKILLQPMTISC
jgi:hypothetical protein